MNAAFSLKVRHQHGVKHLEWNYLYDYFFNFGLSFNDAQN